MAIKQKYRESIVSLIIFLIIMLQNPIWPLWKIGTLFSYFFVGILFLIVLKRIKTKKITVPIFIIWILSCFTFVIMPSFSYLRISSIFIFITYVSTFYLTNIEKYKVIGFVTRFLSIIILISLPAWFFHSHVMQLPLYDTIDLTDMKGAPTIMNNYLFFVTNSSVLEMNRFYSIFDEPGVLGTLSAFILFINKYNFKKIENIIILIGSIFTYSLAFYILFLVGYFSLLFFKDKKSFFIYSLALTFISLLVFYILKEDQTFQNVIIGRFSDLGERSIDRRNGEYVNLFYNNFISSSNAFWGMGYPFIKNNLYDLGNSYKLFIIEYGLWGIIILLLIYLSMTYRKSVESYILLLLFMLSFLQRIHAFTSWQILIFACGVSALIIKKMELNN